MQLEQLLRTTYLRLSLPVVYLPIPVVQLPILRVELFLALVRLRLLWISVLLVTKASKLERQNRAPMVLVFPFLRLNSESQKHRL
jgi:hypothetical protein